MTASLHTLYAPVALPLEEVVRLVGDALGSDHPVFAEVGGHLRGRTGKFLRAAMLLLSAQATGGAADRAAPAGAACEIVHLASLVHDDVIDEAESRRGVASVNHAYGNRVAILFGDWLYCRAFLVLPEAEKSFVIEQLLEAALAMCDGQALELDAARRNIRTMERHVETITRKTAVLFERAMRIGATLGGAGSDSRDAFAACGRSLGLAFQMADDLLDLTADESVLGKPVMSDLRAGHHTAAVLLTLEPGDALAREFAGLLSPERIDETAPRIRELLRESGALARARELAERHAAAAIEHLSALPRIASPEALESLRDLARYTIRRER